MSLPSFHLTLPIKDLTPGRLPVYPYSLPTASPIIDEDPENPIYQIPDLQLDPDRAFFPSYTGLGGLVTHHVTFQLFPEALAIRFYCPQDFENLKRNAIPLSARATWKVFAGLEQGGLCMGQQQASLLWDVLTRFDGKYSAKKADQAIGEYLKDAATRLRRNDPASRLVPLSRGGEGEAVMVYPLGNDDLDILRRENPIPASLSS
jgi:hypothetical protein